MINHTDIITIRELLGLGRAQFAEAIGYSGSSNSLNNLIYRMETGKQGLPIGRGDKIWELFRKTWLKKESNRIQKIIAAREADKNSHKALPFFKDKKDYKEMFNWQSPLLRHELYCELMKNLSEKTGLSLRELNYANYISDLKAINEHAGIIIDDTPEARRYFCMSICYHLILL